MAACVAGQVTEATIELGCYPPHARCWDVSPSQVVLWGPGVPTFMKSSSYEWDDMGAILDLCEEVGFVEGKGPAYEAEEDAHQRIREFQLITGLAGLDVCEFEESHQFIEDPEHAAAFDRWLSGAEVTEHDKDKVILESLFLSEEEQDVRFNGPMGKGRMLLEKMGWSGGPLGCRGSGITEPIEAVGSNDTMGLGYQGEEILFPHEGEEITDSMKLIGLGANYGVGSCSRGTVFIPRGALKHMGNICDQKSSRESPVGETFVCELVAGQGKHPWRLKKVLNIEMTWSAIE